MSDIIISEALQSSFNAFINDPTTFALPIVLETSHLTALPIVKTHAQEETFKESLSLLSKILTSKSALYILLRRNNSLTFLTYIPYQAPAHDRTNLLNHRHNLIKQLGAAHFSHSLICKEIGEITDVRSWEERDLNEANSRHDNEACGKAEQADETSFRDLGHQKNKCRLCDRRMQNPISASALAALKTLDVPGSVVQLTVDTKTLMLNLTTNSIIMSLSELTPLIPPSTPTFTFLHHPHTALMYFIFHSPDAADVRARMTHTMAIPGALVYAEDVGVRVDRKVEVHDVGEVVEEVERSGDGEEEAVTMGKYRSMYDRKGFVGTELVYGNLEGDQVVIDARG